MNIFLKPIVRTFVFAAAVAMACPLTAGDDLVGVWQPYSEWATLLGAMTVAPERLSFEVGPTARLEPVRVGGSIFRITAPHGETFLECGEKPVNYVGFHVLDNGLLAFLHYKAHTPPAEPTGSNSMEVIRNGACAVMFYKR
ncbi:hypothetical protein [Halomonas rhizosphaerae]|uniref:TIGR03067 domain-containing protein n=1 Tax=Halomonas rhizosphaerae TaxID=3043296 RepID=A0ABT6V0S5_9GAMM|nr:hypothetical protein [Halomonas rhizosphaerae]MDI5891837.1 hypothetical protein [Halomonas rhizosphaerae]